MMDEGCRMKKNWPESFIHPSSFILEEGAEKRAMKEAEWLAASEVRALWPAVRHRLSMRQVRLLGCACCRRAWSLLGSERSRRAVALAERFADGLVPHERMAGVCSDALEVVAQPLPSSAGVAAATVAALAADLHLGRRDKPWALAAALDELAHLTARLDPERWPAGWCAGLLRDVAGPLFGHSGFDPSWRTADAVALARRAYDDRQFGVLPLLSDALEEAGCDNLELLEHCRAGGAHGRGCWVLDLVLDKAEAPHRGDGRPA
jgi:hypothetical protein